jgi:hypothetical protein
VWSTVCGLVPVPGLRADGHMFHYIPGFVEVYVTDKTRVNTEVRTAACTAAPPTGVYLRGLEQLGGTNCLPDHRHAQPKGLPTGTLPILVKISLPSRHFH